MLKNLNKKKDSSFSTFFTKLARADCSASQLKVVFPTSQFVALSNRGKCDLRTRKTYRDHFQSIGDGNSKKRKISNMITIEEKKNE